MSRIVTGVALAGVVALSVAVPIGRDIAGALRLTPTCPEDEVLVGVGTFDHGRWSKYICGPSLDDWYPPTEEPTIDSGEPMLLAEREVH